MSEEEITLLQNLISFSRSVDNLTDVDETIIVLKEYMQLRKDLDQLQVDSFTENYVSAKFGEVEDEFFDKVVDILL